MPYDPNKSQTSTDTLAAFIQAPITGNIREVPGIGKVAAERLAAQGITTTFGLIGQFLMFKQQGVDPRAHCDLFWDYLDSIGVDSHRSGIVRCIAEKTDTMFPGVYDATLYC